VPPLRAGVRLRSEQLGGGVACYPEDRLYEEVAYVAYHFHWSRDEVLSLHHRERHRWVEEISKINQKINQSAPAGGGAVSVPLDAGPDVDPEELERQQRRMRDIARFGVEPGVTHYHPDGGIEWVNPDL